MALRTPFPWIFEDSTKTTAHSAAGFSPSLFLSFLHFCVKVLILGHVRSGQVKWNNYAKTLQSRHNYRAEEQQLQDGQVDGAVAAGRLGHHQVRLRVALGAALLQQARDPERDALQAERVRVADQHVDGQRVGHPALHRGHDPRPRRRQVPHHEGPQQADDHPVRHSGRHVRDGRRWGRRWRWRWPRGRLGAARATHRLRITPRPLCEEFVWFWLSYLRFSGTECRHRLRIREAIDSCCSDVVFYRHAGQARSQDFAQGGGGGASKGPFPSVQRAPSRALKGPQGALWPAQWPFERPWGPLVFQRGP